MSNKLLTTEQIYQQIELYCLSNNILYEEEQIGEWADDLLNIIYSIGGAPTSLIVEKNVTRIYNPSKYKLMSKAAYQGKIIGFPNFNLKFCGELLLKRDNMVR